MHHGTFMQWRNQDFCHWIWQGHDSIIHEGQQIFEFYWWQENQKKIVISFINYLFDVPTSTKEVNQTLLMCELSIFHSVVKPFV
jgi:hypothetical protein